MPEGAAAKDGVCCQYILCTVLYALSVATAGLGLTGCASGTKRGIFDEPPFELTAALDKISYRPGEAVQCHLTIRNASDDTYAVPLPDTQTTEFNFGPDGTNHRYQRSPVTSEKDESMMVAQFGPQETIERRFIFTRLTENEGQFAFHAHYRPARTETPGGLNVIAKAILFKVEGKRMFRRDMAGLILKQDAILVVRRKHAEAYIPNSAKATWVRNEAGFYDWHVQVELYRDPEAKVGRVKKAYFVSPYHGGIRAEAEPRDFSKKAVQ